MSLVNLTFDWLQKEWANEVDFVVCTSNLHKTLAIQSDDLLLCHDIGTGDNAR